MGKCQDHPAPCPDPGALVLGASPLELCCLHAQRLAPGELLGSQPGCHPSTCKCIHTYVCIQYIHTHSCNCPRRHTCSHQTITKTLDQALIMLQTSRPGLSTLSSLTLWRCDTQVHMYMHIERGISMSYKVGHACVNLCAIYTYVYMFTHIYIYVCAYIYIYTYFLYTYTQKVCHGLATSQQAVALPGLPSSRLA